MRIVIAPDKFAGTLTAVEAAEAVAEGWHSTAPGAGCELVPLSDGGPGFVGVLHSALGGALVDAQVTGPLGDPVEARYLLVDDTAYVESALACGLDQISPQQRDPGVTSTRGVGELLAHAIDRGATTVVVGLGGSGTNDGGAGLLAALGAEPAAALSGGGAALVDLQGEVDLAPARARTRGVRLIAATDVDNPLLGISGASAIFGPQKGADPDQVQRLDAALTTFAAKTDPEGDLHSTPGAGAAGGLGYALLLLGGRVESGVERVLAAVGLDALVADADLVVTGEGSFDSQSLRGKLPQGVATTAARHGVPCVVLAGRIAVGRAEAAAAGITETYSLVESAGSVEAALSRSAEELRRLAGQVAKRWDR
ncbi:glycerate kinase family protein [Nocardiopsis ansamitocini]|uniref:Glycerate kinase n=1 Tax=Nocardiopsis ansamitocini TaxID=1670832 RepID=A0A9W6P2W7_9ACTN|nr:glycerate kinase [Nocardiopsis ansamitocini]GLU46101.1 glycerate kinase [Nocardiopsis ansamitocini]